MRQNAEWPECRPERIRSSCDFRRRFFVPDAIWYKKIGAENQHRRRII